MALTIGTNVASLQASATASSVNRDLETSMARLSTGKRINSASDDAAGVAISSRLTAEIRGTDQAIRNALDGQALIDTAEGGHKEIESILQRMREISVQAANDTNSAQDRGNLQAEMNSLTTEIDRIAGVTTWAGNSVMDGGAGGISKTFSLQVGAATGTKNQIEVSILGMAVSNLGLRSTNTNIVVSGGNNTNGNIPNTNTITLLNGGSDVTVTIEGVEISASKTMVGGNEIISTNDALVTEINNSLNFKGIYAEAFFSGGATGIKIHQGADDLTSSGGVIASLRTIDAAIKTVNTQRSELGAVSNRLSHTVSNMTNISTNLSAARGGIEDADFALETTNLAKNQILQQASTAMLAQANALKQGVLSLLQ